jgi:hypothetical protein
MATRFQTLTSTLGWLNDPSWVRHRARMGQQQRHGSYQEDHHQRGLPDRILSRVSRDASNPKDPHPHPHPHPNTHLVSLQ